MLCHHKYRRRCADLITLPTLLNPSQRGASPWHQVIATIAQNDTLNKPHAKKYHSSLSASRHCTKCSRKSALPIFCCTSYNAWKTSYLRMSLRFRKYAVAPPSTTIINRSIPQQSKRCAWACPLLTVE